LRFFCIQTQKLKFVKPSSLLKIHKYLFLREVVEALCFGQMKTFFLEKSSSQKDILNDESESYMTTIKSQSFVHDYCEEIKDKTQNSITY
jgi:hypothetical protein